MNRPLLDDNGRYLPETRLADRYEIVKFIGHGGFAAVYEARQIPIDRRVAVKVLNIPVALPHREVFEKRFLQEAKAAAAIDHPNIVTIFDYGITDYLRQPFIAMEYLSGHDLDEELRQGAMSPSRSIARIGEALDALGEAHRLGIVHKDLKPANLFLCYPGGRRETLKVLDFGVARLDDSWGEKLSDTGQIAGTPQYVAPEYVEGGEVTPATDVYQMGLILVECLTGVPVVPGGRNMATFMKHMQGELDIPEEILESPLGPLVRRATSLEPTDRFADAHEFANRLAEVDGSTVHVTWSTNSLTTTREALTATVDSNASRRVDSTEDVVRHGTSNPRQRPPTSETVGMTPVSLDRMTPPAVKVSKVVIGVALVVLVVLGVGALVYDFDGQKQSADRVNAMSARSDTAADKTAATEETGQPATAEKSSPAADALDTADEVESDEEAPDEGTPDTLAEPEPKRVSIRSQPKGAEVWRGEDRLGVTPFDFEVNGVANLSLRQEGFEAHDLTISEQTADSLEVVLRPERKKPKRPSAGRRVIKPTRPADKPKPNKPVRPNIVLPD